jgi:Ca2+-binding EF-hand superfamily protein
MRHTYFKAALIASGAALLIAAGPKADLNQDGEVTKAEFTQAAQSKFFATDTNNDGFLSQDERKTHREAMRENRKDKRFEKLDINGDGLLSRDEMDAVGAKREARKDAMRAKVMEKYDTNLDGTLSEAERTVMKAERKEKRADKKDRRKDRRADRPKPDANGDGFVSMDEHIAVTEQLFARMDANGDGVLTKGEGRKRKGKRGQKRGR